MSFVPKPVRAVAATTSVVLTTLVLAGCPSQTAPPAVAAVTLAGGDLTLVVGDTQDVTAEVSPAGASTALTWEVDDTDVATVEGSGLSATVTAIAAGATTLMATSTSDPTKSDTIEVTVLDPGSVLWTKQFGTDQFDFGRAVAGDADGMTVVGGHTWGAFGGTLAGASDAFVRVYQPDGDHVWTRQFGTADIEDGLAVAWDGQGGVLVAGVTSGGLEGPHAGGEDAYVRKYDADGDPVWTRQFGTAGDDGATGVGVDDDGNVFVAGYTGGSLGGTFAGVMDAFVRKYDPAGNHVWTRQFGTSAGESVLSLAVDASGAVVVAGYTTGDLGAMHSGSFDAFVRKYNAAGDHDWTAQFGTPAVDMVRGIATDEDANVIVTGLTGGPLEGTYLGGGDAFVRKYDSSGNHLWTDQFGTASADAGAGVNSDGEGNVVVSGITEGSLGGGAAGNADAYVRKYTAGGEHLWTRQFGTSEIEEAEGVTTDAMGRTFVVGYTEGALVDTNIGARDVFLRAYGP